MGTVSKALELLELFTQQRPEIGLSDLARLSGRNKATVFRLVGELQAHGFLEQAGTTRAYRLGPAVLRLARLREATVPMREAAEAVLHDLAAETGETAHVSLVQGERLATLAYAYSPAHGTAVRMEDAEFIPYHATSTGHAVLAFGPPELAERVLSAPLPAITEATLTDPDAIRTRLAQIRATGMAEVVGGLESDVHSLAVPLFDATGGCIGALAVATPTARMTPALRATIAGALFCNARRLVAGWGGLLPDRMQDMWSDAV